MVYVFINYQESVVGFGVFVKSYARILLIVFLYILTQLPRDFTIVNIYRHAGTAL